LATLRGTNGSDIIKQNSSARVTIYGYGGDDKIYLDLVDGDAGFNYVDAGSGNDYVRNSFAGGNTILLGDGNDTYSAQISAGYTYEYDTVKGGNGNDTLVLLNSWSGEYYGEAGNDIFVSAGFDEYAHTGVDNDFNGGSGIDTVTYELQDTGDEMVGMGVTIDLADQRAWTTKGHHETLISIENATGTNYGNDDITGSSARNILKGLGGNDQLYGLGGADDLRGGSGSDDLFAGSGDDALYGGSGTDFLRGGSGSDHLNGGTGSDIFDFNSIGDSVVGSRRDVIGDFHRSQLDVVDLETIDANKWVSGDQSFTFIGGQSFHGKEGELRFSPTGIISGDIDGDGTSDFQIKVDGVTKMYSDDFIL